MTTSTSRAAASPMRATSAGRSKPKGQPPAIWLAIVVALALFAAACGGSDADGDGDASAAATEAPEASADVDEPDAAPEPVPTEEPVVEGEPEIDESLFPLAAETIDWEPCGERLQCGTIEVPIDYEDPSVGTLQIAVNVRRTDDLDARVGYLLVNPGGPGESGRDFLNFATEFFTPEILEAFDLVGFDPRGVGQSEPTFACGGPTAQFELLASIPDLTGTPEEIEVGNQAAQLCVDSMGPAALQLGTDEVVQDMDEIRKALGVDQISYAGFSYGSTIGGWYATRFPDRVRAMVVDGAANPLAEADDVEEELQLLEEQLGPIQDGLEQALLSCDDETCPIYNDGDPIGYWMQATDKLSLIKDAADGDGSAVALGIVGHLYTEQTWPALHEAVRALQEDDDPTGFLDAALNAGFAGEPGLVNDTEYINCLDEWALFPDRDVDEEIAEQLEQQEAVRAFTEQNLPLIVKADELQRSTEACLFFGSLDPPELPVEFGGEGVPILVIGNVSDPVTPFVQSEQYANEVLADGRLVRTEAPQHVAYPTNSCVNDFIHAALIDQEYPDGEVECPLEDGGSSSDAAAPADVTLSEFELPEGSVALAPDGWLEVGPGAYARASTDDDVMLVAYQPSGGSVDSALADMAENLGDAEVTPLGDIDVDGTVWQGFSASPDPSIAVVFAVSPGADGVVIIGQAAPDEIDALAENVLFPLLEGFQPASAAEAEPASAAAEVDESLFPLADDIIDWAPCGERLQCGFIEVPIDYEDPSAGTLQIAVNVRRTSDLDARIGYLLINPGGPGASGVEAVAGIVESDSDELLGAFDIVGFDPRGVGESEPTLACGGPTEQFELLQTIAGGEGTPEEIEVGNQAAQLCVDSMGASALQLGTDEVVQDMDEIRKALGVEQISYIGFSYGSTIGGWYATRFPDQVRAMVVDGAANPLAERDGLEAILQKLDDSTGPLHDAFEAALLSCADESCPIYNDGDPIGYWNDAAGKLQIVQDAAGGDATIPYFGIIGNLYSEDDWTNLHEAIRALREDDDPSGLLESAKIAGLVGEPGIVSVTAYVNCLDSWALFPDTSLEEQLEEGRELEDAITAFYEENFPLFEPFNELESSPPPACFFFGSLDPPALPVEFGGEGVTILVVGNVSDPVTPYVQSEQYANDVLADGRLVRADAPQHVVFGTNECVDEYIRAALIDMEYPDEEVFCPEEGAAPGPSLGDVTFGDVEFPDGSVALVPDSWIELGPGVYARSEDPDDLMVLVYEPSGGSVEAAVARVEETAAGNMATSIGEFEVNGVVWERFSVSVPEGPAEVLFAVSPGADGVVILGQSHPDEIGDLAESILIPALEGFQLAS